MLGFVAWTALTLAAAEAPVLRPGETLRLEMPAGAPDKTSVTLRLLATEDGPLTIETSTLHFDTMLRVFDADAAEGAEPLAEDNDSGLGSERANSRLTLEAQVGRSYRVEVRGSWDDGGGPFEVSAAHGAPPALDAKELGKRDAEYWDAVVAEGERTGSAVLEARGLIGRGTQHYRSGEYAAARPLFERAVALRERANGPEDLATARCLDDLGGVLWAMHEYTAARAAFERALAIQEKVNGPEHLETAQSLDHLARLATTVGDYAAARPLFERALAIQEKVYGPDHAETATGVSRLGALIHRMGDYAAARPLLERSLAILEKVNGPDHPETAASLNNLAALLHDMGDYKAARPLLERSLAILEKVNGPEHPKTAVGLNNLATLLQTMGEYAAARPLCERSLAIREKVNGPEHPDTATSLNNLAELLRTEGEYAAARPLYERSLAIREKVFGPGHPETAASLNNLASLLQDMGEYAAARPLFERSLAIQEKVNGPEHPETARSLNNLAALYYTMGEYAAARPLYERALAIREKVNGPEHPETATGLNNLGSLLKSMGEYASARAPYERALAILEKVNGPEHPLTAATLNNLANVLQSMGEYASARPLHERALAIREKVLGPDHPSTAQSLSNLAHLLQFMGEYASARPPYERALAIRERVLGPDHPDVALSLNSLAMLRATQGETAGALGQALEAERIGRAHLKLTGRSLAEREALRYAAVRSSGLNLALTLAAGGLDPADRRRVFDALVRSRALVLDEMAARHRAIGGSADPGVAQLAEQLASRRARLAALVVRGPGNLKFEIYRKLLDDARKEKEEAERQLAGSSSVFGWELSQGRQGLDEVAASLPEGSALVAFSQYLKIDLRPRSPAAAGQTAMAPVPSYLAFVLRAGARDPEVVDLGRASRIDEAVSAWKKEASRGLVLATGPARAEAAYREAGATLRARVWDPLAAAVGDAHRVFMVPDGPLNLVNLASLPLDDGGYLIERGPLVHYVSAERDLIPSADMRRGAGLLALGGPNYEATEMFAGLRQAAPPPSRIALAPAATYRGHLSACGSFSATRFEPLPAAEKETREIVRLWEEHGDRETTPSPGATGGEPAWAEVLDLRGAAATEAAFKRGATGRLVLHLATHGFFLGGECESALDATRGIGGLADASATTPAATPRPAIGENPLLLSGLALAGANHRSVAGDGEEDGILTAEEIASLDLSGVTWAVLSACETGVGDVQAGEGVFGLRRAFQIAGAGTLIISLWSVDDAATRSWMRALYEGRLEKNLDTAEAVRRASLEVLVDRRARQESTHPFYWAAFVAAGDWR